MQQVRLTRNVQTLIDETVEKDNRLTCNEGMLQYATKMEESKQRLVSLLEYGVEKGKESYDFYVKAEERKNFVRSALRITAYVLVGLAAIAAWVLMAVFLPPVLGASVAVIGVTHALGAASLVAVAFVLKNVIESIFNCTNRKTKEMVEKEEDLNKAEESHRVLQKKIDLMVQGIVENRMHRLKAAFDRKCPLEGAVKEKAYKHLKNAAEDKLFKQLFKDKALHVKEVSSFRYKVSRYIVRAYSSKEGYSDRLNPFGHRIRDDYGFFDLVDSVEFNHRKKARIEQ